MKREARAQLDLFQAPVPLSGLPALLRGKTVKLLQRLLAEAIAPDRAKCEAGRREVDDDHNHG